MADDIDLIGDLNIDSLLDFSDVHLDDALDFDLRTEINALLSYANDGNQDENKKRILNKNETINNKYKITEKSKLVKNAKKRRKITDINQKILELNKNSLFEGTNEIVRITKLEPELVDYPPIFPKQFKIINEYKIRPKYKNNKEKYVLFTKKMSNKILSLPKPTQEIFLNPDVPTEEEIKLFSDFFTNPKKGAQRYLMIRNHIISKWTDWNGYMPKTAARSGLKNCGDVNCIGNIFNYLEQKGAINFGHDECRYNCDIKK